MLSECTSRLNQVPSRKLDPRSPYLLQFKIFEDRLKKQSTHPRAHSHAISHKDRSRTNFVKQDYLQVVRNLLQKNENINIFEDTPYQQTEPSIESSSEFTIMKIKKKLDDRRTAKTEKCRRKIIHDSDTYSQLTENLTFESRSRVQSELHPVGSVTRSTNCGVKQKDKGLSFIGYKKNKRALEEGCRQIRGIL